MTTDPSEHDGGVDPTAVDATDAAALLRRYLPSGTARGQTTDAVTDAVREAILDGALAPNTWLREDHLSNAFGVSRTPVREALRRLADEGLTVKTAHHGTVVAPLSLEDVLALYVVREDLEGLAARLATARCPVGLVAALDHLGAQMTESAAAGDIRQMAHQNLLWHRAVREAAGNPYLTRFLNQVEHAVRRLPSSTYAQQGRPEEAAAEHDAVVRAIEGRDAAAAERAAKAHMHRAREIRLAVLLGS